jgi:tetratricopeptide (TPR) repeat protein
LRVRLLRGRGQLEEALVLTTGLLQREPTAADALLAHGILLLELWRPAEALAVLDRAVASLPPQERLLTEAEDDPLAALQQHRAAALLALGRRAEARVALRATLRLSPERAAAADPTLLEELGGAPPSPPGYSMLRRLAQEHLLPEGPWSLAPEPDPNDPAPGVALTALRSQLGELLLLALSALDDEASLAACGELLLLSQRGLGALKPLLPQLFVAHAPTLRAILVGTAEALSRSDLADGLCLALALG